MKQVIFLLILCASCAGTTTYRPSIYAHDYKYGEIIVPVTKERISCREPEFNKYVSFSLEDFSKIALVLKKAELPRHVIIILEKFEKELRLVKQKQHRTKPKD